MEYFLQQLVNGITLGSIYGLIAIGYTMVYGIIGMINFAHGDVFMVGGFVSLIAIVMLGLTGGSGLFPIILALIVVVFIAMFIAAAYNWTIERVAYRPLRGSFRLAPLISAIGMSLVLQEFVRISQGARERWTPPVFNQPIALAQADEFIVTVTPMQIVVAILGLAAACGVLLLLGRTRFGRAWRAFADDPGTAALFGIDGGRLLATTFLLAGLLAGLAGWIVAAYYGNISFSMGAMLGLKALVAAVVGGIGSVPGAFLGGVCVALIEGMWSAYFEITARDIVVFSLLIVVFVWRPGGLLGFAGPKPRDV